jgi:hypothetical protein
MPAQPSFSTDLDRSTLVGPILIFSGLWFVSIVMLVSGAPMLIQLVTARQLPSPFALSLVILAATLPWYIGRTAVRFVKPDRLEVSAEGIKVQRLWKVETYPWTDLGEPRRKMVTEKVSNIEIPLVSKARGLTLPGGQYNRPFEEVLNALRDARSGTSADNGVHASS